MAWQLNANSRRHANHIEFIQLHFVASFIVCLSDHPLRLDVRPLRRVYWRHFRTEENKGEAFTSVSNTLHRGILDTLDHRFSAVDSGQSRVAFRSKQGS